MKKNFYFNFIILLITFRNINTSISYLFIVSTSEIIDIKPEEQEEAEESEDVIEDITDLQPSKVSEIKKYKITYENNLAITLTFESQSFSFAAFVINDDKSFILSTDNKKVWKCVGVDGIDGVLTFKGIVGDSSWSDNKKIPNMASVLECNSNQIKLVKN